MSESRKKRRQQQRQQSKANKATTTPARLPLPPVVDIMKTMQDGNEYGSIVGKSPNNPDIATLIRQSIAEIQEARGRKVICYLANVVKQIPINVGINTEDDLPFREMIDNVNTEDGNIDIILVTPGGDGQQIPRFVDYIRKRFNSVEFILPYMCMSAGTLFALSGDKIWMDERAFLGPIDPQVMTKEGRYIPAQQVMNLFIKLGAQGQGFLDQNKKIPWQLVRLLDNIDPRLIGEAMSLSDDSVSMASEFLETYKFKHWTEHSTNGNDVTSQERKDKSLEIAKNLCNNEFWRTHSFRIPRDLAGDKMTLGIQIKHPESDPDFHRAIRRFWALMQYVFDISSAYKILISENYSVFKNLSVQVVKQNAKPKQAGK